MSGKYMKCILLQVLWSVIHALSFLELVWEFNRVSSSVECCTIYQTVSYNVKSFKDIWDHAWICCILYSFVHASFLAVGLFSILKDNLHGWQCFHLVSFPCRILLIFFISKQFLKLTLYLAHLMMQKHNTELLVNMVRQQFKRNKHETDPEKIQKMKDE